MLGQSRYSALGENMTQQPRGAAMTIENQTTITSTATLGGYVYSSAGDLYLDAHGQPDYFGSGLEALRQQLYLDAADCFRQYLSTTRMDGESSEKVAQAHFCIAVALLGGSPPRYKLPADIEYINVHLDQARRQGAGYPVFHQASVLWAIVKEDYYEADGMVAPKPPAEELQASIEELRWPDLEVFTTHVTPVEGQSWARLAQHARLLGLSIEVPVEDARRVVDRQRATEVNRYFNETPVRKNPVWMVLALLGGVGLVAFAFLRTGAVTVGLLVLATYLFFVFGVQLLDYRHYVAKLRESEPKPPESQLDEWLREDLAALTRRAAARLRLNTNPGHAGGDLLVPVQTVVGIPRDREEYTGRIRRIRFRKGIDRNLRADRYDVYLLFLTRDMVSTYRCELDFATGELRYDETREHHYRDIVGVHSRTIPMSESLNDAVEDAYDMKGELSLAQVFMLSIASGERLGIFTGVSSNGPRDMVEVAWPNKHAMNVVQKMIRAHHSR
jgi:hypothetical protein